MKKNSIFLWEKRLITIKKCQEKLETSISQTATVISDSSQTASASSASFIRDPSTKIV